MGLRGSQGYHLQMSDSGKWTLFKEDSNGKDTMLASGAGSYPLNSWHKLSLRFEGNTIQASIDLQSVATVNDPSYSSSQVGLLVSKWQNAQFDNFSVIPGPGGNEVSIDDSVQGTGTNQFNYVGSGWQHNSNNCQGNPCEYNNDNSWDNTTNDYVTVSFTGVQIKILWSTQSRAWHWCSLHRWGSRNNDRLLLPRACRKSAPVDQSYAIAGQPHLQAACDWDQKCQQFGHLCGA